MIPKIIHYCWYGNKKMSSRMLGCIESWKKFCPDYHMIKWDESNTDFRQNPLLQAAYENKAWALASDIMRLLVVYKIGGIYMDVDVEVKKPLDDLLWNQSYFGFENRYRINTGHGFGAEPGNFAIRRMIDKYDEVDFYDSSQGLKLVPCSLINTEVLKEIGLKENDMCQLLTGGIQVYSSEYFCPKRYQTGSVRCTDNTYSIHHYEGTWLPVVLKLKLFWFHLIGDKGFEVHKKFKKKVLEIKRW